MLFQKVSDALMLDNLTYRTELRNWEKKLIQKIRDKVALGPSDAVAYAKKVVVLLLEYRQEMWMARLESEKRNTSKFDKTIGSSRKIC